jgi:hypothetical protein
MLANERHAAMQACRTAGGARPYEIDVVTLPEIDPWRPLSSPCGFLLLRGARRSPWAAPGAARLFGHVGLALSERQRLRSRPLTFQVSRRLPPGDKGAIG